MVPTLMTRGEGRYVITDRGSQNGTYINDQRIGEVCNH